jgi:predicted metal-binding membrane protein
MLYLGAYVGAWVLAAPLLLVVSLTLRLVIPIESLAIWFAAVAAMMWQISPLKQALLNRCHSRPDLQAFAPAAHVSAFKAGMDAATWCIGTCWAVMVVALSTPVLHLPVMVLAALWIWMERVEPARRPRWGFIMPTALYRLLAVLLAERLNGRVVG